MSSPKRVKMLVSVPPKDIPVVKREIKSALPNIDAKNIRRYKIPHFEAVMLELKEDGLHKAAEYLQYLLNLDEEKRKSEIQSAAILDQPQLKDNDFLFDYLRDFLVHFFEPSVTAVERLVGLVNAAMEIETLSSDWWWIADSLYRTAFFPANEIWGREESAKLSTILRYVYAEFLFKKMKSPRLALEHVRKAQRDSRDKSWSASEYFGVSHGFIFIECCALLQQVLLDIAREVRQDSPQVAVNSCKVALAAAIESGQEELVAETQFELGQSLLATRNVKQALRYFNRGLAVAKKIFDSTAICEAHAQLVYVYKELNDDRQVLEHLEDLKYTASEFQLPTKLAEAHFLAGDYYLYKGNPKVATRNFETAFALFNDLDAQDTEIARCLTGVSKGQEMLEAYQNLLMQCIGNNAETTLRILYWKDRGEPFVEKPISESKDDISMESDLEG